jgi:hypothetical protein
MASGPSRLEEALDRIGRSISTTHQAMVRAQIELEEAREERRWRRRQRRPLGPAMGFGFAAFGLFMGSFSGSHFEPNLIFMGGFFGLASLASFWRYKHLQDQVPERTGGPTRESAAPVDPRVTRVDEICARLERDLKDSPKAVRESLHKPEQTVRSLRDACHALVDREASLRQRLSPEDDARLDREQRELESKVAIETDAVTRDRLQAALRLLENQRAQRSELRTQASRLAAEHTRLLYTLEGIYTQVLKAKSADAASADVVGAGLRRDLEGWANEISAVADALEDVHAPPRERERS